MHRSILPGCLAILSIACPARALEPASIAARFVAADEASAALDDRAASRHLLAAFAALVDASTSPSVRTELSPEAHAGVTTLASWAESEAEWAEILPTLDALASAEGLDPLLAARCRFGAGLARLATGASLETAREIWSPLGLLEAWHTIGPFDNERGGGFAEIYPPETELDLSASYDGKKRPVSWRPLPVSPLGGVVDLDALHSPNDECLAYALTFIHSENEVTLALRIGSDEGLRAWVNGRLIASEDVERPMSFDQNAVRLPLRSGWNALLLKVAEAKGSWSFRARITQLDGRSADGWHEGTPDETALEELATLLKARAASNESADDDSTDASPHAGAIDLLRKRLEAAPNDARAHYLLGKILEHTKAFDIDEHPDTEAARRAIEIDDAPAIHHLLLASTLEHKATIGAERDDNAMRQALVAAAERGSAAASVALSNYYLKTFGNQQRAEVWLERAAKQSPDAPEVASLRARLRARGGFPPEERARLREQTELSPRSPATLLTAARQRISDGYPDEGLAIVEGLIARSRILQPARDLRLDLLLSADRVEDARAQLEEDRWLDPFSTRPLLKLADIAWGRDEPDAALGAYESALEICPESHEVFDAIGRTLHHLDRRTAALTAWDRSLELQPNQPSLRERVEYLRAQESPFELELRRDAAEIARRAFENPADASANDAARYLLDNQAIEVHKDGTTRRYHQVVLQILNDLGIRSFDSYRTAYQDGEQVVEFKAARVRRADGLVEEARLGRFGGSSIGGTPSWRYAGVDLPPLSVGDVVEIEYIVEDVVQSFFGDYFGHREFFRGQLPIEEKVFRLRVPANREFYFADRGLAITPEKSVDDESGQITYLWRQEDIARLDPEPGMPWAQEIFPTLEISTFKDWNAFSKWYWNLIRKQFETSPEMERKVAELTSGKDTKLEKARALYNFVVTDIRYNAWEFGVHGFKPYNASKVFARRFGDCKDKATLLCVLLDQVGVKAYPVLIHATNSRGEEDLTLPAVHHFNHCIAYLPEADGIPEMFLDGTATFHSLEELPSMDRGARVLVVRDDGGTVETIRWNRADELAAEEDWSVRFEAGPDGRLAEDSAAEIRIRITARGDYAVSIRRGFEIEAERKKNLEQIFGRRFAGATVIDQTFSDLSNLDEPVQVTISLRVPRLLTQTPEGLALALPGDFFNVTASLGVLGAQDERTHDLVLGSPRRSSTTLSIALPAGTSVKSLPESREEESRFGRLLVRAETIDSKEIRIERILELTSPRVSLADYPRFREVSSSIEQLAKDRILLER